MLRPNGKLLALLAGVFLYLFAVVIAAHAQPAFLIEVSCPAGSSPVAYGTGYNATTGKYKQNVCIDANGNLLLGTAALLPVYTPATLPTNAVTNQAVIVNSNFATAGSGCGTGTGSDFVWCVWNGAAWIPFASLTPNPIKLTNGTAAAPSYAFTAANYGMYRDGTNSALAFTVNGTNVVNLVRSGGGGPVSILDLSDDAGGLCMGAAFPTLDTCVWRLGTAQWGFGNGTVGDFSGTIRSHALIGDGLAGNNISGYKLSPFQTSTECISATGACGSAAAGMFTIAAGATTRTVSTNVTSANSNIFIQEDSTLGTALGVTCNTTLGRTYAVTTRTANTSFVVTASAAPTTNPACLHYWLVN